MLDRRSLLLFQPKLTVLEKKLWITYTPLDKYKEQKAKHSVYICPIAKNGIACNSGGRSDNLKGKTHQCRFYNQETIASFFPQRKDETTVAEERLSMGIPRALTSSPEELHFQNMIIAMAQCNISFKAICSQAFRTLILCLTQDEGSSSSLDRFVSRLNYHTLSETLIRIGKQHKELALSKVANKTVTVMFDKGRIGKNDCTAVTILVHDSAEGPLFWDLGYPCQSADEYTELANSYVRELGQYCIHVFAFCTDGLPVQKRALTGAGVQESKPVPFMHPIWIYCTNHLANLVVQDAIKVNPFLSAANSCIRDFVTIAHSPKSIKVLDSICPGFAVTRWLALGNISSYIFKHKMPILKEHLLSRENYLMILQLHILLLPLMTLQHALESAETRLSDVFLLLRKTIQDFEFIEKHAAFTGPPLEALRCIITFFYKRFLYGDQGDLYALAYLYTPAGLTAFLQHRFTWKIVYDTSLHYDTSALSKDVIQRSYGLFSFSSLRDSFAIIQRTVRTMSQTKEVLLETEDLASKRRATLVTLIDEARQLQDDLNSKRTSSLTTTSITTLEAPALPKTGTVQEENAFPSEQIRGVINTDYLS